MADQQVSSEPTEGGQGADSPSAEFGRIATIGVAQFLFEDFPAWIVFGEQKEIAPVLRIILGDDDDGSVLLDKTVLITGLLHLISDLTHSVSTNIHLALELPGFSMRVPGGASHVLELVTDIEDEVKKIREGVETNEIFVGIDDERDEKE